MCVISGGGGVYVSTLVYLDVMMTLVVLSLKHSLSSNCVNPSHCWQLIV